MTDQIRKIWNAVFIEKAAHVFIEFIRYFFVSLIALISDFATLFVLTHFCKLHYLVSALIAYTVGLLCNYLISVKWVFSSKKIKNKTVEFSIFLLIGLIGMGVNELLMWLFTSVLSIHFMFSRVLSAGVGYVWKFIARKIVLFK